MTEGGEGRKRERGEGWKFGNKRKVSEGMMARRKEGSLKWKR